MAESNADYYQRRVREELAKAQAATSLELRHLHETMAGLYRIRLRASSKDEKQAA